jgi:hypothetical protein
MATLKRAIITRNAAGNAEAALANDGYVRVYSGTVPATPETAASGTLLAELRFSATAFGSASGGIFTANAITSDSNANNSGTAGWARVLKSDGTSAIWDCDVTATGGGGAITFDTVNLVAGAVISLGGFTVTLPQ